jgi:hypothetical protein
LKFKKQTYEEFSHKENKLKSLGILARNPSPYMLNHNVFSNGLTYNYIISTAEKTEKMAEFDLATFNKDNKLLI